MNRITRWIAAHFDAYRKMDKGPFLWRITLEGLLVILLFGPLLSPLKLPPRAMDLELPVDRLVSAVILAPFFETLLLQALPVMIARRCGAGFRWQVLAGLIFFAAFHFPLGAGAGIKAGVIGGFYLAFTYAHWRQESFRSALWMTVGVHALHNLALMTAILLLLNSA